MSTIPLVKPKLSVPEIPARTLYPHKLRALHMPDKRIAVLTAPAGFGKTTAVLLALKNYKPDIRWYRLEKEDSFLPVFYNHLIEALFQSIDDSMLNCKKTLKGISDISAQYAIINAQICQDCAAIKPKGKRLYIIFDDFHNVISQEIIIDTMRYFISNMPDFVSLFVTSRVETNILYGNLLLRKDIIALFADDLRFSADESVKLITDIYKLPYKRQDISTIFARTEGWIAGIYMLCHTSIQNHSLPQSNTENIFTHYFKDFFRKLSKETRLLLARLSILPDFGIEEITLLYSYEDASAFLARLESSNLYVQKFKTPNARFRFHSLFKHELNRVLSEETTEQEWRELYMNAADFYIARGNKITALQLLLHINEIDIAVAMIRKECIEYFNNGRLEDIFPLINRLDAATIEQSPYLLFFKGITYQNVSHDTCYEYALKALRAFRHTADTFYTMNAYGLILVLAFQTNNFENLKKAAAYLPITKIVLAGGAPLIQMIFTFACHMIAQEKFGTAKFLYAFLDKMTLTNPVWNYSYLMMRGILLYRLGKTEDSIDNFNRVRNHSVSMASDNWKITGLISGHLALNLAQKINDSRSVMAELSTLAEKYDSSFARGFAYRIAAFIAYQSDNLPAASESLQKSAAEFELSDSPVLASISRITQYFWLTYADTDEDTADLAAAELERIHIYDISHGFEELSRAMVGAVFLKCGRLDRAESLLTAALRISQAKKARQSVCGIMAQLINLYYRRGQEAALKKHLATWASTISRNKYVFFWEADRQTLIRACALAYKYNYAPQYMLSLLKNNYGTAIAEQAVIDPTLLADEPDAFLTKCRNELRAAYTVKAKLLGKFTLTTDTTEITDKSFKTRKISGILKYILLSERSVSRDTLTGIFWPESDTKSAFTSLRVALSELRKVLAKNNMPFDSETSLLREDKTGFYLNNSINISTDTVEFLKLYHRYKNPSADSDSIDLLQQIVQLYNGDLLEDDPYDDWLSVIRAHYKAVFIEASSALSAEYIKAEKFTEAEKVLYNHLKIEPTDEHACRLLLEVFEQTAQFSRAAAFKKEMAKNFSDQ